MGKKYSSVIYYRNVQECQSQMHKAETGGTNRSSHLARRLLSISEGSALVSAFGGHVQRQIQIPGKIRLFTENVYIC